MAEVDRADGRGVGDGTAPPELGDLGVVQAGEVTFAVADVPGLIEGASEGRGLGHDFLRHVERCAAIVHVVDLATMEPGRNPLGDLDVIEHEQASYGGLEDRPRLVALNKIDVPDGREISDMVVEELTERGLRVFPISAASGEGTRALTFAMAEIVLAARVEAAQMRVAQIDEELLQALERWEALAR